MEVQFEVSRSCGWPIAFFAICAWVALLPGPAAIAGDTPVPANDECVDATLVSSGTCALSGAICGSNDDCALMTCRNDGADCTTDPEICVNDDVCDAKVCVGGSDPGAACVSDLDCNGGVCNGTCSLSGAPCRGWPGEEPQCAGLDACVTEKCVLRVSGTTRGAVTSGERFIRNLPEITAVPGVWVKFMGTGTRWDFSMCNPGTLPPYYWDIGYFCGDCDRLVNSFDGPFRLGDNDATSTCDPFVDLSLSGCFQEGVEYRIFVHGWRNICEQSCSLSGQICTADEDCIVNECVDSFCLTGEACTEDGDCPRNACGAGSCAITGGACLDASECVDTSLGEYELSMVDTGEPCTPMRGPVDCFIGAQVIVVDAILNDNGDDDGWADTNESVEMRIRLRNYGDDDLTGLVAELSTTDPKIASIDEATIAIGTLAAKESIVTSQSFRFTVGAVDRTSVTEDFSARFQIALRSDRWANAHRKQEITLDLDLDATGGAGATRFHEGFETGDLNTFAPMNLDFALNSLEASDGYRCREKDPDNIYSTAPGRNECFIGGSSENAESFYWQVEGPEVPDGGRSFTGSHALRMGLWVNGQATTPVTVLEAVRSGAPLNVGWGRVCERHRSLICEADDDCPAGEGCVDVAPELSFKHQTAFFSAQKRCHDCGADGSGSCNPQTSSRKPCHSKAECAGSEVCTYLFDNMDGATADRAAVQVQRLGADGFPAGPWITLEPFEHPYESRAEAAYFNCSFDPIDDGSTEDDAFGAKDGPTGFRPEKFGPSSTCGGTSVFGYQGETDLPFDPTHVGRSFDGPGLEGETGLGTWVAPRFSLQRFRGQQVRIRFLNTALELGASSWPPDYGGVSVDGWWIDDVEVNDVLASPATLLVDGKTCTPGANSDGDSRLDCQDCDPQSGATWSLAGETRRLLLDHAGGAPGTTSLSWNPPGEPGAMSVEYITVVRGPGFCDETNQGGDLTAVDEHVPAPGELLQLLVRADNPCGQGAVGRDSIGNPRQGCP